MEIEVRPYLSLTLNGCFGRANSISFTKRLIEYARSQLPKCSNTLSTIPRWTTVLVMRYNIYCPGSGPIHKIPRDLLFQWHLGSNWKHFHGAYVGQCELPM